MGIKGLWDFISSKHRDLLMLVPQKSFEGKRIAVDIFNVAYIIYCVERKKLLFSRDILVHPLLEWNGDESVPMDERVNEVLPVWIAAIMKYIMPWIRDGITPILVSDGDAVPEKKETQDKRESDRQKVRDKVAILLQRYHDDPLKFDSKDLAEYQALMSRENFIPRKIMQIMLDFFTKLGVPVLRAKGDGEQLCSALCRAGIAAAVFSSDGDNLAHGCPILLRCKGDSIYVTDPVTGINSGQPSFQMICLSSLLERLEMDEFAFTDLCIMSGCDYNVNIPRVGLITALKLLKQYGRIEELPLKYDTTCLRLEACRKLFSRVDDISGLIERGSVNFRDWDQDSVEALEEQGLERYSKELKELFHWRHKATDHVHDKVEIVDDLVIIEEGEKLNGVVRVVDVEQEKTYTPSRGSSKSKTGKMGVSATRDSQLNKCIGKLSELGIGNDIDE